MAAKRILKDLDVQFISLVDKGANQKSIILKALDGAAVTCPLRAMLHAPNSSGNAVARAVMNRPVMISKRPIPEAMFSLARTTK